MRETRGDLALREGDGSGTAFIIQLALRRLGDPSRAINAGRFILRSSDLLKAGRTDSGLRWIERRGEQHSNRGDLGYLLHSLCT